MTDKTTGLRCQNGDACAAGQRACPSPKAYGCEVQPEALRLADACAGDWEAVRPHLVVQMLRDQHARIKELESAEAKHQQELRAYELTVQNLRAEIAKDDCILRASVPDRWKGCASPVGAVQSYIAELEGWLNAFGVNDGEILDGKPSAIGAGGVEGLRKREVSHFMVKSEVGVIGGPSRVVAVDTQGREMPSYEFDAQPSRECDAAHVEDVLNSGGQLEVGRTYRMSRPVKLDAVQPSRECLQQSAKNESLARELTLLANVQDERYPNFRAIALEAAAALQAAPPAPAGVAVPAESLRLAQFLLNMQTRLGSCREACGDEYSMKAWDDYSRAASVLSAAPAQEHATQLAGQGQAAPSTRAGLLAAAAHIQAKASAHAEECGSYDPDTGAFEMRDAVQDHYNTLDELAEEMRLLADKAVPEACDKPPAGWACSRTPGHDGPCAAAPAQAQEDARDSAFEAVRNRLCGLQRYSFVLDDDGVVRRARDRTGSWIEFDEAHALFDPVAVDAAIAARAAEGGA